jgi:hypothetical protein
MACVIRLLCTVAGTPTKFDGFYVKTYNPAYTLPDGTYDGGILEVTANPAEALKFPDAMAAFKKYREAYGFREDGEWNRPLTAWTVAVEGLDGKDGGLRDSEAFPHG